MAESALSGETNFLESELEALQSIYMNKIDVQKENETTIVSIDLYPATADNDQEQYVKMTLKLTLKDGYPEIIPEINIRNPRGLSDEQLSNIAVDLFSLAEYKKGELMLFEIIEAAKNHLTAENLPSEECAICLYGFHEKDVITKTKCYHYFHSHCLARFAQDSQKGKKESELLESSLDKKLLCPVCRLPIDFVDVEESYPPPKLTSYEVSVTDTILETQKKMRDLYIKQVEKGGIIDIEAEKNKYLIEISHVPNTSCEGKNAGEECIAKQSEDKNKSGALFVSTGARAKDKSYSKNLSTKASKSNQKLQKPYGENRNKDSYCDNQRYNKNDYGKKNNNFNVRYGNTRKSNLYEEYLENDDFEDEWERNDVSDSYDEEDNQSIDKNSTSSGKRHCSLVEKDDQETNPSCIDDSAATGKSG